MFRFHSKLEKSFSEDNEKTRKLVRKRKIVWYEYHANYLGYLGTLRGLNLESMESDMRKFHLLLIFRKEIRMLIVNIFFNSFLI